MTLSELCAEIKNYFTEDKDKKYNSYTIEGGVISPDPQIQPGQFYAVFGSTFNDGVHLHGSTDDILQDETFTGSIYLMKVPKDVLKLCDEITAYEAAAGTASPYVSESFAGYSYTKRNGGDTSWQSAFSTKLNRYRKIRV